MTYRHPYLILLTSVMFLAGCGSKSTAQALGILERDRVVLKATAAEIITEIPVSQGQNVNPGDVLIQLDSRKQKIAVAKAEANVASTNAMVEKLLKGARQEDLAAARSQVSGARAQWLEADKNVQRSSNLVSQQLLGRAELDAAIAKRDVAQAHLEQAGETLLTLTNGSRSEDIRQAMSQEAIAQSSLEFERYLLAELSIRATRAGRLDLLPKHLGERTLQGEPLAIILDGAAPYARVYIPESARLKIAVGQTLQVHMDGAETQPGKVRWIAQEPAFTPYFALNSADRSRLVYVAEIQLNDTAKNLPSGMPVQVDLISEPVAHE